MLRRSWLLGGIDICCANINHYLSEFLHLYFGYKQANPGEEVWALREKVFTFISPATPKEKSDLELSRFFAV